MWRWVVFSVLVISLLAVPTRVTSEAKEADNRRDISKYAEEVITLTNRERAKYNLRSLIVNPALRKAATEQAGRCAKAGYISHTLGGDLGSRVKEAGYSGSYIGENLAAGYSTPEEVMYGTQFGVGWMGSPGHRANILNSDYKEIGVGVVASGDGTLYWCQVFGSQDEDKLVSAVSDKPAPSLSCMSVSKRASKKVEEKK